MRNQLYAFFIDRVTDLCYRSSLDYCVPGSKILDVGIGNGLMLKSFHSLIKQKDLHIVGIDLNEAYLAHCQGLIDDYGLERHIQLEHVSVERFRPAAGQKFDYVLYSMSFMLLPDQPLVLERCRRWLGPDGRFLFFQTMFRRRSLLLEFVKPRLKYFTTIDFGKVTYEWDFYDLLARMQIPVAEDRLLKREWFKGEYRLIVTQPGNGGRMGICCGR